MYSTVAIFSKAVDNTVVSSLIFYHKISKTIKLNENVRNLLTAASVGKDRFEIQKYTLGFTLVGRDSVTATLANCPGSIVFIAT